MHEEEVSFFAGHDELGYDSLAVELVFFAKKAPRGDRDYYRVRIQVNTSDVRINLLDTNIFNHPTLGHNSTVAFEIRFLLNR